MRARIVSRILIFFAFFALDPSTYANGGPLAGSDFTNKVRLSCGEDGTLQNYSSEAGTRNYNFLNKTQIETIEKGIKNASGRERNLRIMNGLPEAAPEKNELIELKYTNSGPNANKSAPDYVRADLERTVEVAISEGLDPYLALAITTIENPPVKSAYNSYLKYKKEFGSPPIDAIAFAAELKCVSKKSNGRPIDPYDVANPKRIIGYLSETGTCDLPALKQGKHMKTYCHSFSYITNGDSLNFQEPGEITHYYDDDKNYCCTQFNSDPDLSAEENATRISSHYGAFYMRKRVQDLIGDDKNLTLSLQRYNGIGCLGCNEESQEITNNCFDGIHMADRPVYGARVADLMLNTFMNNPEVTEMVLAKQRKLKQDVKSVFCVDKGQGTHTLERNSYWFDQYKYLLGGTDHFYKARINGETKIAQTDNEKQHYLKMELQRRKNCGGYFMGKNSIKVGPGAPSVEEYLNSKKPTGTK